MSGHFSSKPVTDRMAFIPRLSSQFHCCRFLLHCKAQNRMSFFLKLQPRALLQRIDPTTPSSTRNAAPFVAEESGLATNATSAATSSVLAKHCNSEPGFSFSSVSAMTLLYRGPRGPGAENYLSTIRQANLKSGTSV